MTNLSSIVGDNDVLTETSTNTVTNKSIDASQLTGSVAMARLGSGTADSTTFLRGDGTFASAGLTHFSDAQDTSAPNDTVPVNSFEASGTQTNIDIALLPKGTGALTRDIADGTTGGGDKRGNYATDWQGNRSNANRRASGDYSVVSGGFNNAGFFDYTTVSGGSGNYTNDDYATVVGGRNNTATNNYAIAGGYDTDATGWNSVAFGDSSTATQQGAVVLGENNRADGYYSTGIGYSADAKGRPSILCIGGQNRSSSYTTLDHQTAIQCMGGRTADATAYQLAGYKNTSTAYMNSLDSGNAYVFTAKVIGSTEDDSDTAAWEFKGVVRRVGSSSPTFIGTPSKSSIAATAGASAWDADIVVSGNSFTLEVTGAASTNIRWTGSIWTTEVQ